MATDERLRIVIEALNHAKGELQTLQRDLDDVGAAGKRTSKSLKDLAKTGAATTAVLVGAGLAAKKAFDWSAEGAAVAQTRESFDRLGVSLDDLRAKSLGTVDDMTLMSSTLTLTAGASEELQGRLLGAAPQLLEIAKAANKLNPTLGDTAFMYQSIATGVKRNSPLILDNLGIMVKVGEANERYAEQVGKTVEQLSAEERQIALLNATLEAGNRLIVQAGGNVESYTDSWAELTAEYQNHIAAAKEAYAVTVLDGKAHFEAAENANTLAEKLELVADQYRKLFGLEPRLQDFHAEEEEHNLRVRAAAQGAAQRLAHYRGELEQTNTVTREAARVTADYERELRDLKALMGDDVTRAQERYREGMADIAASLSDVQAQLAEYRAQHGQVVDTERDHADILKELAFAEESVRLAQERLNMASAGDNGLGVLKEAAREAESELSNVESRMKSFQQITFYGPGSQENLRRLQDQLRYELLQEEQARLVGEASAAEGALQQAEVEQEALALTEREIRAREEQLRLEEQLYRAQQERDALLDELNDPERYDYTDEITSLEEREQALLDERKRLLDERVKAEQEAALRILEARIMADGVVTQHELSVYKTTAEGYGMFDAQTSALVRQADTALGRQPFQRAGFLPQMPGVAMTPAPASGIQIGTVNVFANDPADFLEQMQALTP